MKVCIKSMKGVAKIVRSRSVELNDKLWDLYYLIDFSNSYYYSVFQRQ